MTDDLRVRADLQRRIEQLRGKVSQLDGDLTQAKRDLNVLLQEAAPFQVGDQASYRGEVVIIRKVEPQSWGACWYRVSKRKKDGDWSKAELQVFDLKELAS